MRDIAFRSAADVAGAIRAGDLSPVEAVEACLDRIDERDGDLNAFVTVLGEAARERAREAERAVADDDDLGPLHGVPIAIKDLYQHKAGVPNTMGLEPLADNVADGTSLLVERLETAGAIVVGTTNTPELGHTMRTYNELQGPTATPLAPDRNAGGSSGGSAAALAAGMCALATGSDVGGSLRIPAACCGVVAVKPTFALIPKDDRPDAFSSHTPVGVVGPMARTVADAALLLSVLVGRDDRDPFSVPAPGTDYVAATDRDPGDFEVAFSPGIGFPVAPAVREVCADAVDALAGAGVTVERRDPGGPDRDGLIGTYSESATPLFAATAARLEEEYDLDLTGADADDVSGTLTATIELGRGHDAVDYIRTNEPRTELYDAVEAVLAGHDALVCPTIATPPLTHDGPIPEEIDGEPTNGVPMDWGLAWPFNMTGHPVVAVPAGLTDEGLPVGLQIVGSRFAEGDLLAIAAALERARPWADAYPGA